MSLRWRPPASIWLSDRRGALLRDGRRMIERVTIVGASPSKWGPYPDEKAAVNASVDVINRVRPDWTEEQKQVALSIGWEESRFGLTPDWQIPNASNPDEKIPSYNWGAVVGKGSAGTIPHPDHDASGKPITQNFAAFASADDGFEYWASRFETRLPASFEAAKTGNARGVSEGMYASCWFSGTCPPSCTDAARIDAYAKVIVGAAHHVMPLITLTPDPSDPAGTIYEPEIAVVLGETVGLPLGKCAWHDGYTGTGSSGGGGGKRPAGGAQESSSGLAWGLAFVAIGIPIIGWAVLGR